jgi:hypothetical protein
MSKKIRGMYKITIEGKCTGYIDVEAESRDDAIKTLKEVVGSDAFEPDVVTVVPFSQED